MLTASVFMIHYTPQLLTVSIQRIPVLQEHLKGFDHLVIVSRIIGPVPRVNNPYRGSEETEVV
jgi:hypothetical protein